MEISKLNAQGWPVCRSRTTVSHDNLSAICSHKQVRIQGNLVSRQLCELCTLRDTAQPEASVSGSEALTFRKLGWDLAVAVTSFVADGARTVSQSEYEARIRICSTCDRRRGNRCRECGCQLSLKARGRVFSCPLDKWDKYPVCGIESAS